MMQVFALDTWPCSVGTEHGAYLTRAAVQRARCHVPPQRNVLLQRARSKVPCGELFCSEMDRRNRMVPPSNAKFRLFGI